MMNLHRIAQLTKGRLQGADVQVTGVTTDSRADCTGKLFVALQGPNFDGHDYVSAAQEAGAAAALVSRPVDCSLAQVIVADTLQALTEIAASWRQDFDIPVVAVTGSSGKTTVKELLGSVLSSSGKGIVTKGNLNNHIGVPLTLTRLEPDHQFAVVEMGMNHAGEIEHLSTMARPTIAIVNNAGAAHLEGLGSIAAVAAAKGEIASGLPDDGVLVINHDDDYAGLWRELAGSRRVVSFGLQPGADVTCEYQYTNSGSQLQITGLQRSMELVTPLKGKHHVMNSLAVTAVAWLLDVDNNDVQTGFANYQPLDGRSAAQQVGQVTLINDAYNANPSSIGAAVDMLVLEKQLRQSNNQSAEVCLVLGDMAELGEQARQLHRQVGSYAANKVDRFLVTGEYQSDYAAGFGEATQCFASQQELAESLCSQIGSDTPAIVLVKGSRSAGMENCVQHLADCLRDSAERRL